MNHYILKNINLIDGTKNCHLVENTNIEIKDNKIFALGHDVDFANSKIINCENKYAVPGLINLHVHLPGGGKNSKNPKDSKKLVQFIEKHKCLHFIGVLLGKTNAKSAFYNGITTVRAVGGVGHFDTVLRNKINSGKIVGPRLFVADYAIAPKDGHMAGTVSKVFGTNDEIKEMVKDLYEHKVDLVKVMITGGVLDAKEIGHPGVLKMAEDQVKAVVDAAHEFGLPVAAHVESREGVEIAIKCHVDTIEHGALVSDEYMKMIKEYGGAFVETISPALPQAYLSPEESLATNDVIVNTKVVLKGVIDSATTAIKKGILVGLGTDAGCPMVVHKDFYRELEYAHLYLGLTREEALYHGTLVNAQILKKDKEIGSIEVGKLADIVITNKNPLDTFSNLNKPYRVIKDGVIYKPKRIKKDDVHNDELLDKCYKADLSKI